VIAKLKARWLVVSFSDEGFLSRATLERVLSARGFVHVIETDYKRYVGAQIGIFNPKGQKVGRVSHLRNREYLFIAGPERLPALDSRLSASPSAQTS
jgi:adenine-specific DNA-methyltransferase